MSEPTGIEKLVCDDIAARQALGIRKYGMTLAQNPAERRERLQHAYEELLDAAVYIKWELSKEDEKQKRLDTAVQTIHLQAVELNRLRDALIASTAALLKIQWHAELGHWDEGGCSECERHNDTEGHTEHCSIGRALRMASEFV